MSRVERWGRVGAGGDRGGAVETWARARAGGWLAHGALGRRGRGVTCSTFTRKGGAGPWAHEQERVLYIAGRPWRGRVPAER